MVIIFTLINIILVNIIINAIFFIYNTFAHVVPVNFDTTLLVKHLVSVIVTAISASCISIIPLYFVMRKYSVPTTIVSLIIVISLLSSSFNGSFMFNDIISIPIALSIIGLGIAY